MVVQKRVKVAAIVICIFLMLNEEDPEQRFFV